MLADCTEAGTRPGAARGPDQQSIRQLVEGIIAEKVEDGQLEESDVTFGELTRIKEAFVDALIGLPHRIPYPGFPGEDRSAGVNVFFSDEQDRPANAASLREFAVKVLEAEGFAPDTELAVILVGPEQMTEYNERFMERKDPPTSSLFRSRTSSRTAPAGFLGEPPVTLGDVFLCPTEIEVQSCSRGLRVRRLPAPPARARHPPSPRLRPRRRRAGGRHGGT
jgi:ssRNA-specific RNase YbeY (16S rRNA maturation enzyme)